MAVDAAQRARCEQIRDKARDLFGRSDVGACESLAELIEWAFTEFHDVYFGTFNNDEETFVEDFGLVLTERSECVAWERGDDLDLYLGYGYAADSCFYSTYQDGSNQVRHFWGYVMQGFQYGKVLGKLTLIREAFPPELADAALGDIGVILGAGLDGIGTALDEVPGVIRTYLCDSQNCFATGSGEEED